MAETTTNTAPAQDVTMNESAVDISPDKDGGVMKVILREGSGNLSPSNGSDVSVHYVGTLLNGEKFDSSRDRGDYFKFKLGEGQVIKGWDIGVATMKKGELCNLICKPEYAYGEKGSPPKIPENATLKFEVELIEWKEDDITGDGGVLKRIITKGEGYNKPNEDAEVKVHIRGIHDKIVFEERDVEFSLGEGSQHGICDGLEQALYKMKLHEKAHIYIQSCYGFGSTGNADLGVPQDTDIEYEVYLASFEKAKEGYEMDLEEKMATAEKVREKGGNFFKQGKFVKAIGKYERIVSLLDVWKEDEKLKVASLKSIGHFNAALCHLKLKNYSKACEHCNKGLKIEGENVKGLFRRGQAHNGMAEFELALKDFDAVLMKEPHNRPAIEQMNYAKRKLKEQHDKEKRLYSKMLNVLGGDETTATATQQDAMDTDVIAEAAKEAEKSNGEAAAPMEAEMSA